MRKKKAPSKEVVQLMEKVKKQLEQIQKPVELLRCGEKDWDPTIIEYEKMDPYWLATMSGKLAGRLIKK